MRQLNKRNLTVWIEGIPPMGDYPHGELLHWRIPQPVFSEQSPTQAAVELDRTQPTRAYAFLGGEFRPNRSGSLDIQVVVSATGEGLSSELAPEVFGHLTFYGYCDVLYPIGSGEMLIDRAVTISGGTKWNNFISIIHTLYRVLNTRLQQMPGKELVKHFGSAMFLDERKLPGAIEAALCPIPEVAQRGQALLIQWLEDEIIGWHTEEYRAYADSLEGRELPEPDLDMPLDDAFALVDMGTVAEKISAFEVILSTQDESAIRQLLAKSGWEEDESDKYHHP
jgi:hypothetical protein